MQSRCIHRVGTDRARATFAPNACSNIPGDLNFLVRQVLLSPFATNVEQHTPAATCSVGRHNKLMLGANPRPDMQRNMLLGLLLAPLLSAVASASSPSSQISLPSYHYGAPIGVECMNRSS